MSNYKIPNDAFTTELARIRSLIGEGKLQDAALSLNQAQRADVQAQAMAQAPEVGNMPVAQGTVDSSLTRAQVREATREAIARGFRPISGELS